MATPIAPVRAASDWSETICVASLTSLEPDNDWLRGFSSGDIAICADRSFSHTRPFASFQPIGGGIPTVTTGDPGGRNYTLDWAVSSEDDLEVCEAILAQPIVHYSPAGQRQLFMAPDPLSVSKIKIKDYHRLSASFIEVDPPPIPDPTDVISESVPAESPGSPSSP